MEYSPEIEAAGNRAHGSRRIDHLPRSNHKAKPQLLRLAPRMIRKMTIATNPIPT